jgi:tetratricopeptide (TPR) repeat protein
MRLAGLLSFFFILILSAQTTLAQHQVLTINVIDLKEQTRSGVTIKCKEGCAPTTSDPNGTAVLWLMQENINSGIVELQVVTRSKSVDWVLISPWDGKWPVVKRSLTVVVARHGDRLILASGKAMEAITARVLKEVTPKLDRQISDEGRKLVLKQQAEAVGLKPEEVDQAIREWGKKATDPYQQGLAALYEKNFPKAEQLLTQSYQMRKNAFQDAAFFLGQALYEQGKYSEAVNKFQEVFVLKHDDPVVLNWLGNSLLEAGRYGEAEPLLKRVLDINEKGPGKDNPSTATSLNNVAVLYYDLGRYDEAEPLLKRALAIDGKTLGENHPGTAADLNNLAELYRTQGRYSEAEPLYKRALAIREEALGKEHPTTTISLNCLASFYYQQGRYSMAEPLYKRALAIREKTLGKDHPSTAVVLNNLALLYFMQGHYSEAEPLYKRALDIDEKALGENHPSTATDLNNLAELYKTQGHYSEAEPLYKRTLDIYEKMLGSDHPNVAMALENYAALLRKTNREEEAAKLESRAKEIREKAKLKSKN